MEIHQKNVLVAQFVTKVRGATLKCSARVKLCNESVVTCDSKVENLLAIFHEKLREKQATWGKKVAETVLLQTLLRRKVTKEIEIENTPKKKFALVEFLGNFRDAQKAQVLL